MAAFFIGLLSVLLGLVSVLIVLIVLMQRPKQEGLGAAFGGGMTDQMFGAQTTNVLQKGTVYLAVMFFVFALVISVLTAKTARDPSDTIEELKKGESPVAVEPEKIDPLTGLPEGSGASKPIQIPTPPLDKKDVTTPTPVGEKTEPVTPEPSEEKTEETTTTPANEEENAGEPETDEETKPGE